MFPQFASTAASFTRASSLMLRVGTDAHLYDEPQDADIARLLESKFDAEKAEGMKRLLALMSQGCDVSNFFPKVVKNVASPSLEVKKLVYVYLVHYAEKQQDEALLSINSFQKDLSDLNPLVRAWALRALSGIRVHVVAPLMLMAIHRCARDPSPYVRRAAANAIPKLYALDKEDTYDALEKLVSLLLDDNSVGVVGAAAAAFVAVCPEHLSFVASKFHRLSKILPDLEEWGQVVLIDTLLRYVVARHGIHQISDTSSTSCNANNDGGQNDAVRTPKVFAWFDSNSETQKLCSGIAGDGNSLSDESEVKSESAEVSSETRLLLQCTSPLLWSHNSAVVLAAATVHWLLAPKEETKRIVKPMIFLLRSSYDSQYVVLANLAAFAQARPSLFEAYYEDFFVRSSDMRQIRTIKLDILAFIATESSVHAMLQEFQAYVRDPDRQFAADTVNVIGRCAKKLPSIALKCMSGLLVLARGSSSSTHKGYEAKTEESTVVKETFSRHISQEGIIGDSRTCSTVKQDREAAVVIQAVLAIRAIVEQHFTRLEKVFAQLVRSLDCIEVPAARAVVIWMVGEFGWRSTYTCQMLSSIFRYLAARFLREAVEAKLQILNCASKIILCSQVAVQSPTVNTASSVLNYLLDLGSHDVNYDVRDRARMLRQLIDVHQGSDSAHPTKKPNPSSNRIQSKEQQVSQDFEETDGHTNSSKCLLGLLSSKILLSPKFAPPLSSLCAETNFLPGSMSYIVHHSAPGYRPLPKPLSFGEKLSTSGDFELDEDFSGSEREHDLSETDELEEDRVYGDTYSSGSSRTCSGESIDGRLYYSREHNRVVHSGTSQSDCPTPASYELKHASARLELAKSLYSGSNAENIRQDSAGNNRKKDEVGLLISLSDTEGQTMKHCSELENKGTNIQQIDSMLHVRSTEELESWLGPSQLHNLVSSPVLALPTGFARLSIGNICVERKKKTLLDFTNGEGLEVKYTFSSTASIYSQSMVCVRLFFHNRSSEVFSAITVKSFEPGGASFSLPFQTVEDPTRPFAGKGIGTAKVVPLHEIPSLDPGQLVERNLHVDFYHRLLPVKLAIHCNQMCFPVKLVPEIGALLKPVTLTPENFTSVEVGLSGMLESRRRCVFRRNIQNSSTSNVDDETVFIAQSIASRVLQYANVSVVSVTIPIFPGVSETTGDNLRIHLRFSGEILAGSLLCLITVSVEATGILNDQGVPVSLKVNCEDSIFGLNMLKQLDEALAALD